MREYETTLIVQPEISDEGSQAILAKLDGILEAGGATRLMCEDHGKRKLAYEIRKFHKGHYYTLMFLDDGGVVPGLERALRMEESVLRFLTIQASPEVADIEARKAEAAEAEIEQAKRAAERAAREAEEAAARREAEEAAAREEAERLAAEDARAETAAAEASEETGETAAAETGTGEDAAASPAAEDAASADAEEGEKS